MFIDNQDDFLVLLVYLISNSAIVSGLTLKTLDIFITVFIVQKIAFSIVFSYCSTEFRYF